MRAPASGEKDRKQGVTAVDFDFLRKGLGLDEAVTLEVLGIFRQQAALWRERLDAGADGWRETAHTVKGAARGVGATALGDACEAAEKGAAEALPAVRAALAQTLAEIEAFEARLRGPGAR